MMCENTGLTGKGDIRDTDIHCSWRDSDGNNGPRGLTCLRWIDIHSTQLLEVQERTYHVN